MIFAERLHPLTYAIRPGAVAKYLGQLLVAVGLLTLPPAGVALYFGETQAAVRYLGVIALFVGAGWAMNRLPAPKVLHHHEALVITASAFLLVPLVMAWPLGGHGIPPADALFEAVSAITTTGLSTLPGVAGQEHSFLFERAWMQWYGGLGIVALSVALLSGAGPAARRLARTGSDWDDLAAGTRVHAQRVLTVYLLLTAAGVVLLHLAGLDWNTALLHTLAGISTGGFSSFDANIAAFPGWAPQALLMLLTLAGAVSLALYHPAYYRSRRDLTGHVELKGLLATIGAVLLLGVLMHLGGAPWGEVLHHAPLLAVSAQTGAGFSSMAPAELDPASKLVLIFSMFIGGSVGSTAGGIKIIRLLIVLRLLQLLLRQACMPLHAVSEPGINGHRLEGKEIQHALLIILAFFGVVLLSWLVFLAHGAAPLDALFDVVSATATVGLSSGVTGPDLPLVLKAVLCLDMLLGRLEVVALLLVVYPPTWIGRRME